MGREEDLVRLEELGLEVGSPGEVSGGRKKGISLNMCVEPNVVIWATSYPQEVDEATNEGAPRMDNFCCI